MQVINPPLFGVIAGVVVGLSPAGPLLFLAPSPSASRMPFELKIVVGKHCPCLCGGGGGGGRIRAGKGMFGAAWVGGEAGEGGLD